MSELPEGWVEAEINDIAEVVGGGTPSAKDEANFAEEDGVPWITPADLSDYQGTYISRGRRNLSDQGLASSSAKLLPRNSVLLSSRAPIGYCAIAANPIATNQGFRSLVLYEGMSPEYVRYFLLNSVPYLQSIASGTTFLELSGSKLKSVRIPVAPAAEQKRIAAKIDSLTAKSARARTELTKIEALVERYKAAVLASAFDGSLSDRASEVARSASIRENLLSDLERHQTAEMAEWDQSLSAWEQGSRSEKRPVKPRRVAPPSPISETQSSRMWSLPQHWDWVQIGSMAFVTKLAGFEYTKHVTYDDRGDLPVLKAENAGPHGFRATDYSRVASSSVASLRRSQIFGGEVLVVFVGAGVGNVAAVPTGTRFFLGPNIGMVRPYGKHLNPKYLEYFLRSEGGKSLLLSEAKAVAQPSISMGAIRNTPVPMCHLDEQLEIVHRIEAAFARIDLLATEAEKAAILTSRLDQRILAHAFGGALTQQNPADEPAKELLARIKAARDSTPKRPRQRRQGGKTKVSPIQKLNEALVSWPDEGLTFDELRKSLPGSYEAQKDAIFDLLSSDPPKLRQEFDEDDPIMKLKKV